MECQNIPVPFRTHVIVLDIHDRLDRIHVAAEKASREINGEEDALAGCRVQETVLRVVTVRRNNLAGSDSAEGVRAGRAKETRRRTLSNIVVA